MSLCAQILAALQPKERAMTDTHHLINNLRHLMIDGALVLSFAVLVTVELPL
jgi:hypothetical protein